MLYLKTLMLQLKKLFATTVILTLVFSQFTYPTIIFAQELTPAPESTPIVESTPAPVAEPSLTTSPDITPKTDRSQAPLIPSAAPESIPTPEVSPSPEASPTASPSGTSTNTPTETPNVWVVADGGYTLNENVVLNKEYTAPQNFKVKIKFTSLPANSGKITIKEVKLTPEQQAKFKSLTDTAYDITSSMIDGTFTYDLTLPVPLSAQGQSIEVKAGEDVNQTIPETLQENKTINSDTVTIYNLNHFTVYTVSADTNGATGTGSYTTTSGPILTESSSAQIAVGTLALNVPTGFAFDTGTTATATVSCTGSACGTTALTLDTSNNNCSSGASTTQTVTPTNSTITIRVCSASSNSNKRAVITWSNIKMRPTVGTPLRSGNITLTGTIGGATFSTNTFTESVGAASASQSTVGTDTATVNGNGTNVANITVTLKDAFGNPISGKTISLAKTAGPGTPTISAPTATNGFGVATFTVSSNTPTAATAGTDTFTATDTTDTLTITQTVDVTFIDVTAPVLQSFTSSTTNGTYGPTSAINITATYNEAPTGSSSIVAVTNTGVAVTLNSISGNTLNGTYTVGATGSGQNTPDLTVSSITSQNVIDAAANTQSGTSLPGSNIATTSDIVIDTTAPVAAQVTSITTYTSDNTPNYTFSSTEVGTITYGGDCSSATTSASVGNNTITFTTLADGLHNNCTIKVTDISSNQSNTLSISSFTVDTVNPVGSITAPTNSSSSNTIPAFTATASDATSGVASVKFQYKLSTVLTYTDLNTDISSPYAADWGSTTLISNSTYNLQIIITDNTSNTTTVSNVSFTYDIDAPGVTYNYPLAGGQTSWYRTDPGNVINIDFLVGPSGSSPLDNARSKTGSNGYVNIFTVDRSTDYTDNWDLNWNNLSEGENQISLRVSDVAGNTNTQNYVNGTAGFIFRKDTVAPTASWAAPATDSTIIGTGTLTANASDTTSGVASVKFQYKRNDGVDTFHDIVTDTLSPYTTPWDTTPLALDTYTTRIIVTDNAGNITIVDQNVDVAAVTGGEQSIGKTFTGTTITWNTDRPTSGRIVYDIVSHSVVGLAPNYGYAFSTNTVDLLPHTTTHTITLDNLIPGVIYYFRLVSAGSPTNLSSEYATSSFGNYFSDPSKPSGGTGSSTTPTTSSTPKTTLSSADTGDSSQVLGASTFSQEGWELLAESMDQDKIKGDSTKSAEVVNWQKQDSEKAPAVVEGFKNELMIGLLILAGLLGGAVYLFRTKKS